MESPIDHICTFRSQQREVLITAIGKTTIQKCCRLWFMKIYGLPMYADWPLMVHDP